MWPTNKVRLRAFGLEMSQLLTNLGVFLLNLTLADLQSDVVARLRANGASLKSEDWRDTSRVQNWRHYIDPHIRKVWAELTDEARGLAYLLAEHDASREEWD